MNLIYITGASSGIGKAVAELLLQTEEWEVIGLSRRCTIEHPNYTHQTLDLASAQQVHLFEFQPHDNYEQVVLFNNAGTLGGIKKIGNSDDVALEELFFINTIAPVILSNKFIRQDTENALIINVSSGAGSSAIPGWAGYCASKAAIDLFSETVALELQESESTLRIFSVAPGVVDSAMQGEIRKATEDDFSRVDYFKSLKENNELASPHEVALKFKKVIETPSDFDTCFSLRDVSL